MANSPEPDPFHIQPVLANLYHSKDLLDFDDQPPATASPNATSLFSSATQIAAAAGRRAAAVASAATASAPPSSSSPGVRASLSPDRSGGASAGRSTTSSTSLKTEVRCVEGYGNNLYVGGSDGVVQWWVCDGSAGTSENRGWTLRYTTALFPRRPVSKIVLLPKVSRAFILSDGTLHPYTLPGLDPVQSSSIPPLRGVVSVALNDDELDLGGPDSENVTDMTVVIVRRKGIGIYRLGSRMTAVKEIPLPAAPTHHALFSTYLCAALPSDSGLTYSIIDLSDASMTEVLPVSQIDPSIIDFEPNPNVVVIPGESQFLVTSYTGSSTMGVFLNGQGDPERGTMEWPDHPLSIAVESGYIIALLRNNTIHIHSLAELERPAQIITLDPTLGAFQLSYSPYGVSVRDLDRDRRMATTRMRLLGGKLAPNDLPRVTDSKPELELLPQQLLPDPSSDPDLSANEEPPSGSGLTPPSSPQFKRQPIITSTASSLLTSIKLGTTAVPFSSAVAETLIVGLNDIQGLPPTPTVLRLEWLCAARRMDDAIALVDEERRKGRRGEIDADKVTHAATLRLLHLYLASHLFLETMFERAGDYFIRGKVDPRILVRLYPDFRGKVIGTAEEVDVLDGLLPVLEDMNSVELTISDSISRNYSSHVHTSSKESSETGDIRMALYEGAKSMLTDFLRKTRTSRRKGGGARGVDSRKIDIVIDTTLAKLLADSGTTNELLALLASPNDVVLAEIEPFLVQRKYVLSTVMRQQGRVDRVLELLKEIAEDPTPDPLCLDPVGELVQQLEGVQDVDTIQRYALWIVKRDMEKGLGILFAQGKNVAFDDVKLVEDLRAINDDAANRYLEHVVVGKRSPDRALHEALLDWLVVQAGELVHDDGVKYHLEELDAEYRLLPEPQAFPVFFASIAPATPIKSVRLKLIFFLRGSPFYDLDLATRRLEPIKELAIERAIVLGRLGRDREALQILARDLQDAVSAQTYCTQGGEIVPPKVARAIVTYAPELATWAALGDIGRRRVPVDARVQHRLVMDLLGTYMRDETGRSTKITGELLAAQGVHLDVLEVLTMVPSEWPLDSVATFYRRSFRRQLHMRASWQVLKSISAGQNMEVSEAYLDEMALLDPVVVGKPSPMVSLPDEGSIAEKEFAYDEKVEGFQVEKNEKVGFFEPDAVDKELEQLRGRDGRSGSGRRA